MWMVFLGVLGRKGGDYPDMTRKAEEEGGLIPPLQNFTFLNPKKVMEFWMGLIDDFPDFKCR